MDEHRPSPLAAAAPSQRHYGLDWLRIGAFVLLIVHHIGMYFVTDNWIVKSAQQIDWLHYPMLLVLPWRLAILFVISGFASAALLGKLGGMRGFAEERSRRLLIPLLFGMAVIVPPQIWVRLMYHNGYQASFWEFWTRDYFRFGSIDGVTVPGWEHLWFVFYLWLFTMLLVAALAILPARLKQMAAQAFGLLTQGWRLLWLPLLYFIPVRVAVTFVTGESHGLLDYTMAYVLFLPLFLIGFGFAHTPALWQTVARLWRPALMLSALCYVILVAIHYAHPNGAVPSHELMALDRAASAVMMWSMVLVLLRCADTLLNRDHPWRKWLSEAVFPFYIVHQTAIVTIGWWLLPRGLGNGAGFAIMLAGTAFSCVAFYLLGRSVAWFAPFAGLKAKAPSPRPQKAIALES